jgi:hypothetical protein
VISLHTSSFYYLLSIRLALSVPPPGFKWKRIWKDQLKSCISDLLIELKFPWTDGAYPGMVQHGVLDDNKFDSIKALTDPTERANKLYETIQTLKAKTVQALIELLRKFSQHETLAVELERLYNDAVKLYGTSP